MQPHRVFCVKIAEKNDDKRSQLALLGKVGKKDDDPRYIHLFTKKYKTLIRIYIF